VNDVNDDDLYGWWIFMNF